ncbi:MAG: carbohydrate binding domain-containing protein [Prevotella sp.]|nr:carbohydrate binding domain-containing protein [Prevotella sp.]
MKKKSLLLTAWLLAAGVNLNAQVVIDFGSQQGPKISPMLYGIFFEDINHAADGGLYAELISNRSFEDSSERPVTWRTQAAAGAAVDARIVRKSLLNDQQHQALELTINAKPGSEAMLLNEGFWGINVVQGRTYSLSFWAKGNYKGDMAAALVDARGNKTYARVNVDGKIGKNWTKYTATLTAEGNDEKACFALIANGKGTLTVDVVSLFPPTFKNRANGCRPDLAQMLYQMHPKFMRFPGGCFVEGQESPDNAFRWERTIGPIEEREGHLNRNWNYRTSDGLGFHEYLQLAEDLEAKPLYVVNVGLWHGGLTPVDSLQPWIDECLNALEYANGPVTTKYGAMRAANGHPEPFNIEYLEIGNENNQPNPEAQSDHYYDRYRLFKNAVLAKYPQMHLIGNVVAWGDDNPKWESGEEVELLDEHYYRSPAWFTDNFHKYDAYSRTASHIYCGEYAVTQGFGRIGNLNAALGEAVFMMGMENNGDVVDMASYAPIFVNENNVAWQPDMIRFNSARAMGTPSYYVQQLFANNIGTRVIPVVQTDPYTLDAEDEGVPSTYQVGLGSWATQVSFDDVKIVANDSEFNDDCSDAAHFTAQRGAWAANGGIIQQTSNDESCVNVLNRKINGRKYTYSLRARKDAGNEGFLIIFNYVDKDNYCWFNLGGWNNTQHGLEQIVDGGKGQAATVPGRIETGRWYDVKIEVDGDSIICYLDNQDIFHTKLKRNTTPGIFTSASLDEPNDVLIVKVVNTSTTGTTAQLNINNVSEASVIRLSSAKGTDENTLMTPTNIYPVCSELSPEADRILVDIPAYSLNIIRIKQQK